MSNKRRKVQQHGSRLKGQLKGLGTPGLKHKVPKPGKSHGKPGQNLASKSASASAAKAPTKPKKQQQNQRPTIPFSSSDSILLVGEGDLSFARSLVEHHGCVDVTATVLEKDLDELVAKYPHAAENVKAIESSSPTPPAGCDADASSARSTKSNRVLFGVDARKMAPLPGGKQRSKQTGGGGGGSGSGSGSNSSTKTGTCWDRIVFNFPHVGGKSTDVNRQVRYNQELLVDFFGSASARRCLAPGGAIVVTLFEAEPYTLWNVRDLARHSGLQVGRSFAFSAGAYPGYRHARTLGVVRSAGGKGDVSSAAWRGEDRAARSYVFYRKGEVPPPPAPKGGRKKRKLSGDDDDDDDEDDGDDDRGDQIRGDSLNSGDDNDDDQDDDDDDDDDKDEDNGDPSGADSDGDDPSDN
ncbi:hypothetical protein GGTG_01927 [Gaeumannomyces tritici R3-111a-1]|uniref:25S rRNA (uridine-N(3))-methyltransferase BMT5-like domain-containing protein n=1 Tax=Gaeumannomyces tritici (strain R3-111a-1) TaxID=644352 RepID=J3NKY6_GAET3|nr:hypothetical protein GGTG_01927 [Gaeumannomyces tritici R3-111a-1]EJT81953.1 hypothetical protein GGTG_01927 [Gaeumannomyces tritici R3-111a-1]